MIRRGTTIGKALTNRGGSVGMNRRCLLVTASSFVLLPSGCLSASSPSNSTGGDYESENMIKFGWEEESPLVGGLSPHSESQYHVAVIESSSDSDVNREYLRENEGEHLLTFLDETSFEMRRILAIQARHSSGARYLDANSLRIDVDEQIEGSISIGTAEGGAGAENRETLFVRIEVDEAKPTNVQITIQEEDGDVTVSGN